MDIVFGRKELLDGKGPFDDNVFKNPARYIQLTTSGAKNVRGKMQRVLLTNQLTNNLTVAKIVFESVTLILF